MNAGNGYKRRSVGKRIISTNNRCYKRLANSGGDFNLVRLSLCERNYQSCVGKRSGLTDAVRTCIYERRAGSDCFARCNHLYVVAA